MNVEKWAAFPGSPGYEISNEGRHRRADTNRILVAGLLPAGYRFFKVSVCGKSVCKRAAGVVAAAFIGPRPTPTHQVNHKNGIKADDRAENLEWVTPSQNVRHRFDILCIENLRGSEHPNAFLTEQQVGEIKAARLNGASHQLISNAFGITVCHAKAIAAGRIWAHVAPTASHLRGVVPRMRGVDHHNCRLTEGDVRAIRNSPDRGVDLAKRYAVSPTMVGRIRAGKAWSHVA